MTSSSDLPLAKVWTTQGDGVERLQLAEATVPRPGPTELVVKITAVSLNYRDLLVINGHAGWRPAAPVVPISDGVGTVVAVGDQVRSFLVGARVSAAFLPHWKSGALTPAVYTMPVGGPVNRGMLAEYVLIDESEAVAVPQSLSDVAAATLPVAAVTAWHAVARRCRVAPGHTVLIHGTGGVSLFALQFALALGARVAITSSSDEKLAQAKALGADQVINYRQAEVATKVLAWTGGVGVDHVIETIGGENLNVSLAAVKLGGAIAFIGLIAGLAAPINTYEFVTKNVTIHGIETGSHEMYAELAAFIDEHHLEPVVDSVFPVAQLDAGLRHLTNGGHFGKIVVTL